MTDRLSTGTHWVAVDCPRCGVSEAVAVTISSVLTQPEDEPATLRIKAKTKPVDHVCGQAMIDLTDEG